VLVGRRARTASRVLPLLGVVLATATGCGFLNALAHPPAPDPEPIAAATPAPPPPPPPVIVDGDLQGPGGGAVGRLVVTLGRPRTGLVPPLSNTEACDFDPSALQYLPVEFASTVPGLAAHVEVSTGPTTPTDIGNVGIFVESNDGDQVHCDDSPRLPTRDTFFNQAGARAITAWVVLSRAVTPATPDGRPEVFPTVQLRISDLREMHDATTVQRRLVPGALGTGAPCADDARAICVPLG
jgi:hypothetical protein